MDGRSSRRWLPVAAAVAVVVLAVSVVALTGGTDDRAPVATTPRGEGWQPMSASPLSARLRPTVVGWGDRVVVLGGDPWSRPCPPNASCARDLREAPRDAAVYDVPGDTWERLPDAPLPLDVMSSAVLGDALHLLLAGGEHVALDLRARQWERLPSPAGAFLRLVPAGDRLVAHPVEVGPGAPADQAYDPSGRRWEALPPQPLGTSFDRTMVWTGEELVLVTPGALGKEGPPFLEAAVLRDGAWVVLPDQEVVIGGATDWSWTGSRVVGASTMTADGGEVDGFGRSIPSGGYLHLSEGWSTLPPTPEGHERGSGPPYAAGGRWVANGEGLVLDTERGRWHVLPPYDDQPDQEAGAAWAAGRLVVWGGAAGVQPAPEPDASRLLASGAVWTPPQG